MFMPSQDMEAIVKTPAPLPPKRDSTISTAFGEWIVDSFKGYKLINGEHHPNLVERKRLLDRRGPEGNWPEWRTQYHEFSPSWEVLLRQRK